MVSCVELKSCSISSPASQVDLVPHRVESSLAKCSSNTCSLNDCQFTNEEILGGLNSPPGQTSPVKLSASRVVRQTSQIDALDFKTKKRH
jgi:hypothetical protein